LTSYKAKASKIERKREHLSENLPLDIEKLIVIKAAHYFGRIRLTAKSDHHALDSISPADFNRAEIMPVLKPGRV
jgi:hypothetical protein